MLSEDDKTLLAASAGANLVTLDKKILDRKKQRINRNKVCPNLSPRHRGSEVIGGHWAAIKNSIFLS